MSNSTSPLISPSSLTVGSTNTPPTTAPSSPLCKDDIIEDGKKAATEEGVRTGDDENTPEEEVEPQPTKKDAASKKGFPTATAKRKASNASTESKPKKARQSKAAAKSTPKGGKSTAKKNATPTKGKDDNDSDGGNDGGAKDTEPPSSQSRSWSSEMDAMVMDMAKNGHKDAEIKDSIHSKFKCDRSISAIKQRRQALEAKSAKWSKDEASGPRLVMI